MAKTLKVQRVSVSAAINAVGVFLGANTNENIQKSAKKEKSHKSSEKGKANEEKILLSLSTQQRPLWHDVPDY